MYKELFSQINSQFHISNQEVKKKQNDTFKVLKEKKMSFKNSILNKTMLSKKGEIMILPDKHRGSSLLLELPLRNDQRRQWHPTPVLLPGKSHGRGRAELDTTERLHLHFSPTCIGEGNGNPLQCSCLENPRDGEAWQAAVYGAAQSRTRLR